MKIITGLIHTTAWAIAWFHSAAEQWSMQQILLLEEILQQARSPTKQKSWHMSYHISGGEIMLPAKQRPICGLMKVWLPTPNIISETGCMVTKAISTE